MLISDLDQMESIVSKSKSLSWDGWNVVELIKSASALKKTNGVYLNGSWFTKNVYSVDRDGWRIPAKYVR